jgi:hypothetical protein
MTMKKWALMLTVLGLLLLVHSGAALNPASLQWEMSESETTDGWLIAGGTETATITIKIPNSVTVTSVSFSIDPVLGTFDAPTYASSSTDHLYSAVFRPGTKSGTGTVTVDLVFDEGTGSTTGSFICPISVNIDHNTPYAVKNIDFPSELLAYSDTAIHLVMVDRYGNLVDNKYESAMGTSAEKVRFYGSPSTSCFLDESGDCIGQQMTAEVDSSGNATAPFRLSHVAGENIIYIDPEPVRPIDQWITIYGIGSQEPWSMNVLILPTTLEVPIGGSQFTIVYTLYDRFGNPSPNSSLVLTTDLGGTQYYTTNLDGEVSIKYGPKGTVGSSTLTAIAQENTSVMDLSVVWFVWPSDIMQLVAIPQLMPSLDVDGDIQSEVIVLLAGGNVEGESITFNIKDITVLDGTQDQEPYLIDPEDGSNAGTGPLTVQTNNRGEAIVYLRPGHFTTGPVSHAKCLLEATWGTTNKSIEVEWRNDPYVSVETKIYPPKEAFAPGETIYIEIWLKGDGIPILVTHPVDVALVMNRGDSTFGDMYWDGGSFTEDKMVWAVYGAMGFVENIQNFMSGSNQMALVTYGPAGMTTYPSKLPGLDNTNVDDEDYINGSYLNPGWDLTPPDHNFNDGRYPAYPRTYAQYAGTDLNLGNYTHEMQDELWSTTPSSTAGGTDLCPMRYALYESIDELTGPNKNTESGTIRAMVLLTDRQWDSGGDILAGGSWDTGTKTWSPEVMPNQANTVYDEEDNWPQSGFGAWVQFATDPATGETLSANSSEQNMAILAKKHGIKVYVLAYPNKANNIPTSIETALRALADSTGGKFYLATSGNEVYEAFQNIADDLKVAAAVNTSMNVDFVQEVGASDPLTYSADDVFNYTAYIPSEMPGPFEPLTNESTAIRHWNWSESYAAQNPNKNIFSGGILKNYAFNQSADWEDDQMLEFGTDLLGTINIKETWMTRFGLEINSSITETRIFELFGPNSSINFEYGSTTIPIPLNITLITIDPGMAEDPDLDTYIDLSNLSYTDLTIEKLSFDWDLAYNGTDSSLTEIIEFKDLSGAWRTLNKKEIANTTTSDSYEWIILDQPLGVFTIRITITSDDAGFDREEFDVDTSILANSPYIKIV